jgi:shikimate dehydrogenase
MNISGTTCLLGVIGNPVSHSLSPVMHNAALAEMGLDVVYLPFPVQAEWLAVAIAGLAAVGVQGFNVTIPHKQQIMPLLAQVSELAQAVGAVNTVWRSHQGWCGTNTDVEGFLAPLKLLKRDWSQTIALCLGYGGAARAVVSGCAALGCPQIQVVGRNPQKLAAFQRSWQGSTLVPALSVHPWDSLLELLPQAGLIINTTPIGMHPATDESPLTPSQMAQISASAIAYDLIYVPNPTLWLAQMQQRGNLAIDGLEMLIQQGAAGLRLWTQQDVPVETMRRALQQHLGLAGKTP